MKKDKVAGLIDPDVSGAMADLNLPIMMTITLRKTIGDVVWDGTKAINGDFERITGEGNEIVTKFGLHHGDSVRVFLMKVKG